MQTLSGTILQPKSATACNVIEDGVVRIDDDGQIAEVGSGKATGKDVVGDAACWIVPGFIDAHLHVPQWDRRGIDGYSLTGWHEKVVYPAEARMMDPSVAERLAEDFADGMIANGTTTVASFGCPFAEATDRTFTVFERRGLRAIHGMMLNDTRCPGPLCVPANQALDQARELATKWHGKADGRLSYAFSPRTPLCCSEGLMRGAAELAKMIQCYIQTHVAESLAEIQAVRTEFPELFDDVDVLVEMGLLTPRTLLGHGVFLNPQQRGQVAQAGTAVVHCPTANLFLEAGLMDYVAIRDAGIPLALGSSIAGGHDPFMPRVAVECLQTAKALRVHAIPRRAAPVPKPAEAWWVLTGGAAKALDMGDRTGAIEAGFEADCLVVRPEPWVVGLPARHRASGLLYTLRPEHIEHVFIAGKRVGP